MVHQVKVCQACGGVLHPGDNFVAVSYGKIRPNYDDGVKRKDYFHKNCDVGIAQG